MYALDETKSAKRIICQQIKLSFETLIMGIHLVSGFQRLIQNNCKYFFDFIHSHKIVLAKKHVLVSNPMSMESNEMIYLNVFMSF